MTSHKRTKWHPSPALIPPHDTFTSSGDDIVCKMVVTRSRRIVDWRDEPDMPASAIPHHRTEPSDSIYMPPGIFPGVERFPEQGLPSVAPGNYDKDIIKQPDRAPGKREI